MKAQKLNKRQAYWVLYLSRFDFTLKHVLGTKRKKADRLSRRQDWKVGTENNNSNQTLIKDHWIYNLIKVVIAGLKVDIVEKIKKARSKNEEVVRVIDEMKKIGVKVLRGEEWQIEGDLVLKKEKMYVLNNEELRVEIIQLHYDMPVVRHGEKWNPMKLVMRNYWWYVEGCDICQRMKIWTEIPAGKLKLSEIPGKP